VVDDVSTSFALTQKDCVNAAPKRRFVSNIYYIRDYAETVGDSIPTLMMSAFNGISHQAAVPLIRGIEGFIVELGIDDRSKTGAAVTLADLATAIAWTNPLEKNTPVNRGDGIPDKFVRCTTATPCTAADLVNVVLVKIYVLARNLEQTPGHIDSKSYDLGSFPVAAANDRYQRHVFSTSVRVQNVSARREMP
jgi:type IV pilus assembly protein PilW